MSDPPRHRLLLDTHTVLWALGDPDRLSDSAREAVLEGPNVLSVVSYWEVVIKCSEGLLVIADPREWWAEALDKLAATSIPIHASHVRAVYRLPPIHKDPFDRMLLAQALSESLTLVSADDDISRYASTGIAIVR